MNDCFENSSVGHISRLQEVDENEYLNAQEDPTKGDKDQLQADANPELLFHEKVLHNYFGEEIANSFLHPVIDTSVGVAGMSVNIRSKKKGRVSNKKRINLSYDQTISKLNSNAEKMWTMLRETSTYNIEKEDKKIGKDLKKTFDSFAMGCINRNMTPPQRSFAENKDLIEIAKVVRNKKIEKSDLARRKKQLMYNLSCVQEGNQNILMREKSFLRNADFEGGVKELFFPPIYDNINENISENKEIFSKQLIRNNYHQILADLDIEIVNEKALFNNDDKLSYPGLRFFTESDSQDILKTKRQFMKHMDTKDSHKDNLMENIINKSRRWEIDDRIRSRESFDYLVPCHSRVDHQKLNRESESSKDAHTKQWQPLTLGAVMDFKITKKPTFVDEQSLHFRQGSVKLWRPKLAQT